MNSAPTAERSAPPKRHRWSWRKRLLVGFLTLGVLLGVAIGCLYITSPRITPDTREKQKQVADQIRREMGASSHVEIFAIEPNSRRLAHDGVEFPKEQMLLGYKTTGMVGVSDQKIIGKIAKAMEGDLKSLWYDITFRCFEPHHAVRFTHGKDTRIVVICYGCRNGFLWTGGGDEHDWPTPEQSLEFRLGDDSSRAPLDVALGEKAPRESP